MMVSNQERNASVYKDTKRSLVNFHGKKDLLFSDVDIRWLNKYEVWLRSRDLKDTSISFYFRTFRALFNKAIAEKIIKKDVYPFEDFKFAKFKMQTKKRALSKEDMKRIIELELLTDSRLRFAQQVFSFIYFAQGINIKDVSLLQWKNINQGLKEIAKILDIDTPLSTYVARHTYATVLKKGGGDISKISQALGHTDLNTTKIYLKDFDDDEIDKMNDALLL